jgi:hypothetical protein
VSGELVARPGSVAVVPAQQRDEVWGHNTLARFHAGCRCGWCESASLERCCVCRACCSLRDHQFFTPPSPLLAWWPRST